MPESGPASAHGLRPDGPPPSDAGAGGDIRFELLVPPEAEAVLLVEQDGDDAAGSARAACSIWSAKCGSKSGSGLRRAAGLRAHETDCSGDWPARFSRPSIGSGPSRRLPVVEDMAVPPDVLPEFLVRMQNVLKRHQVTASLFCSRRPGQVHSSRFSIWPAPAELQTMRPGRRPLSARPWTSAGAVGGEHGMRVEPHRPPSCSSSGSSMTYFAT